MQYLLGVFASFIRKSFKGELSVSPPPGFIMPPLITAVSERDLESARDLLEQGADANVQDYLGSTPTYYAADNGDVDMLLLLFDHGAHIAPWTAENGSPLIDTIASNEEGAAKILMARGAKSGPDELSDLGMTNYIRWMPDIHFKLYQTSLADSYRTTEYLSHLWTYWTSWTQPLQRKAFKLPPLLVAVTACNVEAARSLLEQGADVNTKDHDGYMLVHYAALVGDAVMLSLLLDWGADIAATAGRPPKTSLAFAITNKQESAAKILMARGATTGQHELWPYDMASYIRWMPDDQFKTYRRRLL